MFNQLDDPLLVGFDPRLFRSNNANILVTRKIFFILQNIKDRMERAKMVAVTHVMVVFT